MTRIPGRTGAPREAGEIRRTRMAQDAAEEAGEGGSFRKSTKSERQNVQGGQVKIGWAQQRTEWKYTNPP